MSKRKTKIEDIPQPDKDLTTEEEKGIRGGRALPPDGFVPSGGPGLLTGTLNVTHEIIRDGAIVRDEESDTD